MSEHMVSAREAARMIGKTERTVRRWVERGTLAAKRDETSGLFQIRVADLAPWLPELEPGAGSSAEPAENSVPEAKLIEVHDLGAATAAAPDWTGPGWIERAVAAETRLAIVRHLVDSGMTSADVLAAALHA